VAPIGVTAPPGAIGTKVNLSKSGMITRIGWDGYLARVIDPLVKKMLPAGAADADEMIPTRSNIRVPLMMNRELGRQCRSYTNVPVLWQMTSHVVWILPI
jgi:hypothetical protein